MSEKEKKKKEYGGISRREFLRDAGIIAGGAAIGTTMLMAACKGEEVTKTVTTTVPGTTTTVTVTPAAEVPGLITPTVNGEAISIIVKPHWDLAFVLREKLGLVGLKVGCDRGTCGTCTVIMDGKAVYSCMILAMDADGKEIETIEGLSDGITLHPVQQSFVDNSAFQCGYCTPGQIMAAKALLDKNPNPTHDEVREGMSGHFCSCGNDKRIVEAVEAVGGG